MRNFSKSFFTILLGVVLAITYIFAEPIISLDVINPTPTTICSTGNDSIVYTVTASSIPANTNIVIYQSTDSTFNPYQGQGDSIGYIKGDTIERNALPNSECVDIIGIFIDACNPSGIAEYHNEYMFLNSGNGLLVDSIKVDLPNNNGTGNGDINMGTSGCTLIKPSDALMTTLRQGACSTTNFVAVGPGDFIPAHAIVLLFTSNNVTYPYNFDNLCQGGVPIYVVQNSCTRVSGAFVNDANCTNSRYRTTIVYYENCVSELTYDRCGLTNQDGNYAVNNGGDTASIANGGIKNNAVDYCNGIAFDSLIVRKDTLTYHINQNQCNTGIHYIKAITNPQGTQPVSNTISYQLICNDIEATTETTNICSGDSAIVNISSTDPNATFSWTISGGINITGAVAGTGNSIRQLLNYSGTTNDSLIYNITSNDNGCTKTTSVKVVVNNCDTVCNLSVSITGNTSICNGSSTTLTAQGQFDSVRWNTGATTSSITINQAGTYIVTAYQGSCSATATATVTQGTISVQISGDTAICNGARTTLSVSGQFDSIRWNTGETTSNITVNQAGTYSVTAYQNGCSGTASVNVTQTILTPTITGGNVVCGGTYVTLSTQTDYDSVRWNTNATTTSIDVSTSGQYNVTVYKDGCSATADFFVAQISLDYFLSKHTDTICTGDTAMFVLFSGDIFPTPTDTFYFTQPGRYLISYTTTMCGVFEDSVVVEQRSITQPTITGNLSICENGRTTLDAGIGYDSYSWQPNNETSQTITVSQAGTYTVTVTSKNCQSTASAQVVVTPTLQPFTLGNDTAYCGSFNKILSTGNDNTVWNTGETAAQITITEAGQYIAAISNACSTVSDTIDITQYAVPTINIGNDTAICGTEIELTAPAQMQTYLWSTGSQAASITVSEAGIYWTKIIDVNGCTNADTINITSNCVRDLWLPNSFTPNGDNLNDVFYIRGNNQNTTIEKFVIYDRWGLNVFEATNFAPNDRTNGWNGKYKDKPCQLEVYGYYAVARFSDGQTKTLKGNVTLLK